MNDIRRSILWAVFAFSLVMLWDAWQVHNGRAATFFPKPKPAATAANPATSLATPAAGASAAAVPAPSAAATPAGTAQSAPAQAPISTTGQTWEVSTDVLKLTFASEGGNIVRAELLKHRELDAKKDKLDPNKNVVLLDRSTGRAYEAQSGLLGMNGQPALPSHLAAMSFSGDKALKDGQNELTLKFESQEMGGVKYVKTYTLKRGEYAMAVKHDIVNTSGSPVSAQLYMQLVRDGNKPAGESAFYSTFTGPVVYTAEKKYEKAEFTDIEKNKAEFQTQTKAGYVAMVQHYFGSAWLLPDGIQRDNYMSKAGANLYSVGMKAPMQAVAAGATQSTETRLFIGPQEENKLEALYPGLELIKDYGWLTILAKPLYWIMDKLFAYIGNWGWTIMALVLLLKIAFYWLNATAYRSMAKMKAINPKIMEMRERLKDKPQQMQQEMMRIYREEKVNPMGGCFPIMIQIPVFIALYWVLLSSVEVRGAPWIGWITDLSVPDPWFILPVVMAATTMLQTALNPTPPDPLQAKLMWYMPLIFSVMFFFFPAGLVLYWITNNVLSIAQQWMINKSMGVPPQFNLPWKKAEEKKA
ncbi:membrane protein insertase YidC [Variovorax sp. PCZ-1]|uniref:membrane protein insertase YidC n=1 Tax=Variovorax sp. PCZ-1 TaxID=2835533 RepID=UPI001BCAD887|nr:membrane protein insertase YidC [Variovorax sp. PCZ-1]MBS7808750.1 membrane protein insertase YidC [Variovorax sp. PCZ-1]